MSKNVLSPHVNISTFAETFEKVALVNIEINLKLYNYEDL